MVTMLFDQAEKRDPTHGRRWIVLVDGDHQLECLEREAAGRGVDIDIIVDFVHVLKYVWKACRGPAPRPARRVLNAPFSAGSK
jgi:hypothetical protein